MRDGATGELYLSTLGTAVYVLNNDQFVAVQTIPELKSVLAVNHFAAAV